MVYIKGRVVLTTLSEPVQEKIHAARITLTKAAEALAKRDFEKAGVRVIERPDGIHWSSQEKPVQSFIDPEAQLVLFTPLSHGAVCAHQAVIVDSYRRADARLHRPGCGRPPALPPEPATGGEEARDPEAEAALAAERQRQDQREEALIVAGRVSAASLKP
jgi:hypothetical protein